LLEEGGEGNESCTDEELKGNNWHSTDVEYGKDVSVDGDDGDDRRMPPVLVLVLVLVLVGRRRRKVD